MCKINLFIKNEKWCIITVYLNEYKKNQLEEIDKQIEVEKDSALLFIGDFNIRIANSNGCKWNDREKELIRKSKDMGSTPEAKEFIKFSLKNGLFIMNGNFEGDCLGEYTYIEKGKTVIDFGLVNCTAANKISRFYIAEEIKSDHLPLVVELDELHYDKKNDH